MKGILNRTILIASVLVALAVILNNWLSGQREQQVQRREEASLHIPDYFLRGFAATTMDQQGLPDHQLAGELMLHYGDDGSMELTQPHLTLYAKGKAVWHLEAAKGVLDAGGTVLTLSGGVHIHREDTTGRLELITDNMLIRPKDRYAETDAALSVHHAQGQLDAVGLRAYLNDERLLLMSQVRGRYVPTQP